MLKKKRIWDTLPQQKGSGPKKKKFQEKDDYRRPKMFYLRSIERNDNKKTYKKGVPISLGIWVSPTFWHFQSFHSRMTLGFLKFALLVNLRSTWLPGINETITNKQIRRGYPYHQGFWYPVHFGIFLQLFLGFVSFLRPLIFGRFGYLKLKKRQQINK